MIGKLICFLGDEKFKKHRLILLYISLLAVLIADVLVKRPNIEFIWDGWPGWWAIYGLISCWLIVYVSKFIGHQGGLMKDKDYYLKDEDPYD